MDRSPLPKEAWYAACASVELAVGPVARRIHDRPIVLFRGEAGAPAALLDRCPHRGVALSLGAVSDGQVACAYHGWRFGRDGVCAHIPSLPEGREVAAGVAATALPCVEQDGYVWVWTGHEPPRPGAPPQIDGFADRSWIQAAIDLDCEAILPIENNLDIAHPNFTHPGLHPQWFTIQSIGFRDLEYRRSLTDTGLLVTGAPGVDGVRLAFDLPDRVTVDLRPFGPLIVMHHTPVAPGRCRQHWLFSRNTGEGGGAPGVRWTDKEPEILAQDRRVMESAQRAYDAEGDAIERSVEADAPTLLARRIVDLASNGRWPEGRDTLRLRERLIVRS